MVVVLRLVMLYLFFLHLSKSVSVAQNTLTTIFSLWLILSGWLTSQGNERERQGGRREGRRGETAAPHVHVSLPSAFFRPLFFLLLMMESIQ